MDVQKAYDTMDLSALDQIMQEMSFPTVFISWVMTCISIMSYRYTINGQTSRILKARMGLRQGDPISPPFYFGNGKFAQMRDQVAHQS